MIQPFLKWAGGKRWLTRSARWLFPDKYNMYIEPFLGSGAVYFFLEPKRAVLSDANKALIETYVAIRDDWRSVEQYLKFYSDKHSTEFYYLTRENLCVSGPEGAARFLYLNRTCYNGLYRVNLKGQFNVPRGTKNKVIMDTDAFSTVSDLLKTADLKSGDFTSSLRNASNGDFVFLDPPYTVAHNNNGFLKYNENIFAWSDQTRLRDEALEASRRGAKVLILNAKHQSIEDLYSKYARIHVLERYSVMSGSSAFRRGVDEVAIQLGYSTCPPTRQNLPAS